MTMASGDRNPSFSFRLPEELDTRIEKYADKADVSKSRAVRRLINFGLEAHDGPRSNTSAENDQLRKQLEASQYHLEQLDEEIERTLDVIDDGDS